MWQISEPIQFREIDTDGTSTRLLVEQVGAVDIGRLGELAGHLSPEEQWGVDAALLTSLGLKLTARWREDGNRPPLSTGARLNAVSRPDDKWISEMRALDLMPR
jgi:hypothetical protein